jgi:PKD repeat protein
VGWAPPQLPARLDHATDGDLRRSGRRYAPIADPGGPYDPAHGYDLEAGNAFTLDGTGSVDLDGGSLTYAWNFGDGSTGTGAQPSHTYAGASTYNITLTVTDDEDTSTSSTTTATVGENDAPPEAHAGPPVTGTVGLPVTFDGSGSSDDGGIAQYQWDFGDGAGGTSALANPTYSYATPGVYEAVLTVTDSDNAQAQDRTLVFAAEGNAPPVADAGGPHGGRVGEAVTFDGAASTDDDGEIASWTWFFGDGNSDQSADLTVTHTYEDDRPYRVTLTVVDGQGTPSDSDTTIAVISAAPCDTETDGVIDRQDILEILNSRGQSPTGSKDPRDSDLDGDIDTFDARRCVFACDNERCAPSPRPRWSTADDRRPFVGVVVIVIAVLPVVDYDNDGDNDNDRRWSRGIRNAAIRPFMPTDTIIQT